MTRVVVRGVGKTGHTVSTRSLYHGRLNLPCHLAALGLWLYHAALVIRPLHVASAALHPPLFSQRCLPFSLSPLPMPLVCTYETLGSFKMLSCGTAETGRPVYSGQYTVS